MTHAEISLSELGRGQAKRWLTRLTSDICRAERSKHLVLAKSLLRQGKAKTAAEGPAALLKSGQSPTKNARALQGKSRNQARCENPGGQ